MRNFDAEFNNLVTLNKFANKDCLLYINNGLCFVIDKNIYNNVIIKKIEGLSYGIPHGLYLYADIKNMVDALKEFNKVEIVIDEDNCISIRNYNKAFIKPIDIQKTIYEELILRHLFKINSLKSSKQVFHIDNARTLPKFEEAINMKSSEGGRLVWLNSDICITIFKNFLPVNKTDLVMIDVYDAGEMYTIRHLVNKKKYSVEIISNCLKLR